ncbi:LuxR C-terminal-related transcriptional regulator [Rhizosphaericola mali]|uniref:LuxR family transcriptional regulator n=1 Tax=Rhizosphaericola mali TaxID=2545455 RepID=A0A5P2G2R3_9BACT|nr:LuxR C-terminal-related transcriptional regulator [Rhizosphaericola mali]QES87393.1 LuxR family transcriptional regulator [Rhizosphaericola mali]
MNPKKHLLMDIWNNHPDIHIANNQEELNFPLESLIANIFSVGDFYYFTINFTDQSLYKIHPNILSTHGLKELPKTIGEILDLMHPDDLIFVRTAEQWCFDKAIEIGIENRFSFKASYCFRMKMKDGSYQLFHHQAILFKPTNNDVMAHAINIHTNLNAITTHNNYIVTISGLGNNKTIYQNKLDQFSSSSMIKTILSKREREIIDFIAKGHSSVEISKLLYLSEHTIRTHRKNILKKTNTKSSTELIKYAFENGII